MKVIHRINNTEIYKVVDGTYAILSMNENDDLANCLSLFNLKHEVVSDKEIKFDAKSVLTLEQFLSKSHNVLTYNIAIKLTLDIVKQILYLEEVDTTMPFISPNDIIVLDNTFIILNNENKYKIKKNHIQITSPYTRSSFMSIKQLKNKELPLKLYYTEVYYSIGVLLIYCIFNARYSGKENLRELLGPIYHTRLYWFILKCLDKNPKNRKLLFF